MQYIVHKRFREKCLSGYVNLPFGTKCESCGEYIIHEGRPLVAVTSENAHQFFARDDDGKGERRGALIPDITGRLSHRQKLFKIPKNKNPYWSMPRGYLFPAKKQRFDAVEKERKAAWARIWDDPYLRKYKRKEYADFWLWNHDFFNASIEDLEYILKVVKGETNGQNHQN